MATLNPDPSSLGLASPALGFAPSSPEIPLEAQTEAPPQVEITALPGPPTAY